MSNRMQGRTALVTGGASGFGEGIVRRFLEEGARVAIADLNLARATALARELGSQVLALQADVSDDASVHQLAQAVLGEFGRLDVLVNNAGVGQTPMPLETQDGALFERIFATNARSVFLTAKYFVPQMKEARSGAILNVASTGGVRPRPGLTWYNASKGWMITATRGMAVELAPFGIRVNAINPVAGETPMLSTFMGQDSPEGRARMVASIPLGRLSTPADMGAAAAYLCCDDASMVTGVALEVDGGRCI